MTKKRDAINPAHYHAHSKYEVIQVVEAWGLEKYAYLFNVVKYICRTVSGKRRASLQLQDLKKAQWYLNREIKRREGLS